MAKAARAARRAASSDIAHAAAGELSPLHEAWGGALALALINTEMLDRGRQRDVLSSPDALARWWAGARAQFPDQCAIVRAGGPVAWTSALLDAVLALRRA